MQQEAGTLATRTSGHEGGRAAVRSDQDSRRPPRPLPQRPPRQASAPAAPPVTTKPASPPADQVNATPSAADQEVAGFKKQLDAHAKKLQALTMARDFMKDQQFSDLVDEMDDKVQMAQQAMEELSSATGAESTKLMSEVSATLQDIADLDKKAVARLQEIKDDV